ncbi:hypothetical protein Vafri_20191, partial [Volvox africanus]
VGSSGRGEGGGPHQRTSAPAHQRTELTQTRAQGEFSSPDWPQRAMLTRARAIHRNSRKRVHQRATSYPPLTLRGTNPSLVLSSAINRAIRASASASTAAWTCGRGRDQPGCGGAYSEIHLTPTPPAQYSHLLVPGAVPDLMWNRLTNQSRNS